MKPEKPIKKYHYIPARVLDNLYNITQGRLWFPAQDVFKKRKIGATIVGNGFNKLLFSRKRKKLNFVRKI